MIAFFLCFPMIPALFLFIPALSQPADSPVEINRQMLSAIKKVNTLTFTLKMWERFGNDNIYSASDIRMVMSPLKVYILNTEGNNVGAEILWVSGENDGDALVKPPSFPYFNLDLDPYGSLIRKNVHHTLFDLGFDYFRKIIEAAESKLGNEFIENLYFAGDTIFDKRPCYVMRFEYKGFKYQSYTLVNNETLREIAGKRMLNDYRLMELNPDVDGFDIIEKGEAITLPNLYAKKIIMFIDKKSFLPVVQMIYDDKGLYEKYEFYNLKVNLSFPPGEFTKEYEKYGF